MYLLWWWVASCFELCLLGVHSNRSMGYLCFTNAPCARSSRLGHSAWVWNYCNFPYRPDPFDERVQFIRRVVARQPWEYAKLIDFSFWLAVRSIKEWNMHICQAFTCVWAMGLCARNGWMFLHWTLLFMLQLWTWSTSPFAPGWARGNMCIHWQGEDQALKAVCVFALRYQWSDSYSPAPCFKGCHVCGRCRWPIEAFAAGASPWDGAPSLFVGPAFNEQDILHVWCILRCAWASITRYLNIYVYICLTIYLLTKFDYTTRWDLRRDFVWDGGWEVSYTARLWHQIVSLSLLGSCWDALWLSNKW